MMAENSPPELEETPSALEEAVRRVGDRWSLLVVDALLAGPRRFGELEGDMPGVAPNILSRRLKDLEGQGLVVAVPYSNRPLRYAYELSAPGMELAGALKLLEQWGAQHGEAEGPRHPLCGTPLAARWYCPTCGRIVEDPTDEEVGYA